MTDDCGWVDVVGYQHEVLHTGVMAALLGDPAHGPDLAARLTDREPGEVSAVCGVRREKKLNGARGKPDLRATLTLDGGERIPFAVETKVHSDATGDQLGRITSGVDGAEGILLALGLTSLKMTLRDAVFHDDGHPWYWVGPGEWLATIENVSPQGRAWLEDYRRAVGSWEDNLANGARTELDHLQWMNEVLALPDTPSGWDEIRTLQGGPFICRFDGWGNGRGAFLQFAGAHDGKRSLSVKAGVDDPGDRDALEDLVRTLVEKGEQQLRSFSHGGRSGGHTRTVLMREVDDPHDASQAAADATTFLDRNRSLWQ